MKTLKDIINEEIDKMNKQEVQLELGNTYKTRDGSTVTILFITEADTRQKAAGIVTDEYGNKSLDTWALNGTHFSNSIRSPLDIILDTGSAVNEEFLDDEPVWFKMSETGQIFKGHYAAVDNDSDKHCVYVRGTAWMSGNDYMEVYAVMKSDQIPF